jgi:hypothetical protein
MHCFTRIHREIECRINIIHSLPWILHLGSSSTLGPVSNSPPPARCIRLLPDPKASRVPGHVVPSVHRDPFEVVSLFGAERMEFKSPPAPP